MSHRGESDSSMLFRFAAEQEQSSGSTKQVRNECPPPPPHRRSSDAVSLDGILQGSTSFLPGRRTIERRDWPGRPRRLMRVQRSKMLEGAHMSLLRRWCIPSSGAWGFNRSWRPSPKIYRHGVASRYKILLSTGNKSKCPWIKFMKVTNFKI